MLCHVYHTTSVRFVGLLSRLSLSRVYHLHLQGTYSYNRHASYRPRCRRHLTDLSKRVSCILGRGARETHGQSHKAKRERPSERRSFWCCCRGSYRRRIDHSSSFQRLHRRASCLLAPPIQERERERAQEERVFGSVPACLPACLPTVTT